jgi:hypothetical protein
LGQTSLVRLDVPRLDDPGKVGGLGLEQSGEEPRAEVAAG